MAYVTDWGNKRTYVRHITPFSGKPIRFFKVKHGDAVLSIPASDIARIVVTDKEKNLCMIVLKDNRTFYETCQEGWSWIGENEFGGSFFIEWNDWQKVEFLK
ncbi:hypothetical protein QUF80_15400 [Desulfococcaceae bacterium HSG8]|nr:hypothetical protein [Desulfococcaceae bacterium HSG8]